MKYLFAPLLAVVLLSTPTYAQSPTTPLNAPQWPAKYEHRVSAVKDLIASHSALYGLTEAQQGFIFQIINCENRELEPGLQSRIIQADGTREPSFGLVQIHLPSHPITQAQASDPEFAIKFIVKNVAAGREDMWSCARILKHN